MQIQPSLPRLLSRAPKLERSDFQGIAQEGVAVETFLQSTDPNRVGPDAPYPKEMDGHLVLELHQQMLGFARSSLATYQTLGASSPLTLAGLTQALRNRADATEAQAKARGEELQKMSAESLVSRLGTAARTGLSEGGRLAVKVAGNVLLGGSLYVGLAVAALAWSDASAGMGLVSSLPTVGAGLAGLGTCFGSVAGLMGGVRSGSQAFGTQLRKDTQEKQLQLKAQAEDERHLAGVLEQWYVGWRLTAG